MIVMMRSSMVDAGISSVIACFVEVVGVPDGGRNGNVGPIVLVLAAGILVVRR